MYIWGDFNSQTECIYLSIVCNTQQIVFCSAEVDAIIRWTVWIMTENLFFINYIFFGLITDVYILKTYLILYKYWYRMSVYFWCSCTIAELINGEGCSKNALLMGIIKKCLL